MSAAITVSEHAGVCYLRDPFRLERGGALRHAQLAYEAYGDARNPTVVVLGGISAGRRVTSAQASDGDGWWSRLVGAGRAIDTDRYHVIGIDYLGGAGASTSPSNVVDGFEGRSPFPSIDTRDQARAIVSLLDGLDVRRARAIVGSSYGGMVALAFGACFAERTERIVAICAAHAAHPMATALRALQRDIVRLGLRTGNGPAALALARGVAVTTYRTAREFAERFDNRPAAVGRQAESSQAVPAESFGERHRFPVEAYLAAHGERFVRLYSPESFLVLSESLDLHHVDPADVKVPTTLIGFDGDSLVPPWQLDQLAAQLGAPCRRVEIATRYGHDAFLKEYDSLGPVLRAALEVSR